MNSFTDWPPPLPSNTMDAEQTEIIQQYLFCNKQAYKVASV